MPIGFIGLGNLGQAMAQRLVDQSTDLIVYNRTRSKAEAFGAAVADSPAALTSATELIFLSLFDSEAVRQVLFGPEGIVSGDCSGKIIIDTTTNHYKDVIEFHEQTAEHGAVYLEAPIFGSVIPASRGALTIVTSGDQFAYISAKRYLEILGEHLYYLPDRGTATRMKLVNNLVLGSFMATLAEAVRLGEKAGLPRDKLLEILTYGAGSSGVLNAKKPRMLNEEYEPHFSVDCIEKDLKLAMELADEVNQPLFTAPVARELFARAASEGLGDRDFSVLFDLLKKSK